MVASKECNTISSLPFAHVSRRIQRTNAHGFGVSKVKTSSICLSYAAAIMYSGGCAHVAVSPSEGKAYFYLANKDIISFELLSDRHTR